MNHKARKSPEEKAKGNLDTLGLLLLLLFLVPRSSTPPDPLPKKTCTCNKVARESREGRKSAKTLSMLKALCPNPRYISDHDHQECPAQEHRVAGTVRVRARAFPFTPLVFCLYKPPLSFKLAYTGSNWCHGCTHPAGAGHWPPHHPSMHARGYPCPRGGL